MNELAKVTRFEVIDHTERGEGRVFVKRQENIKVETSLQDNDRTLKVFITDTKSPIPVTKAQTNQLYAFNLLRESVVEPGSDPVLDNIVEQLRDYIRGEK